MLNHKVTSNHVGDTGLGIKFRYPGGLLSALTARHSVPFVTRGKNGN